MECWLAAEGSRFVLLDEGWVAYSAISGETHLLNEESVAIVEALKANSGLTIAEVCSELSQSFSVAAADLELLILPSWNTLVDAGLVQKAVSIARP